MCGDILEPLKELLKTEHQMTLDEIEKNVNRIIEERNNTFPKFKRFIKINDIDNLIERKIKWKKYQ